MKRIILLLFIFLKAPFICFSAGENIKTGSRSAGMANASVCLHDMWSIYNNQAGLASIKKFSAGISFENRFMLKELSNKTAAIIFPFKSNVFGLSVSQFGFSLYNENKIGLSYSKNLNEKLSAGVQLNYLTTHIGDNFGNTSNILGEIGFQYILSPQLTIGAHLYNPYQPNSKNIIHKKAPTIIRFGISYLPSDKIIIAIETEKTVHYNPIFKVGIEYHPVQKIYIRSGVSTNPIFNAAGFGLEFTHFKLDFAASYHQTLGFTPHVSIIYQTSYKKNNTK